MNVQEIMCQLLQGCSDCGNELKLTRLISETKSGLGSYFYISCECGVINRKVFDSNTKTVLGE